MRHLVILTVLTSFALSGAMHAQLPNTLAFQGRINHQSTGAGVQGNTKMTFRLYNTATGGPALWTEVRPAVPVNKGLFKVELGTLTLFPATLFDGKKLFLGMQVGNDPEMTPRSAITSQAYARLAKNALDVSDADIHPKSVSIGTAKVIDSAGNWVRGGRCHGPTARRRHQRE